MSRIGTAAAAVALAMVASLMMASDSGRVVNLPQALETADANQPNLRAAEAQTRAAWARANEARGGLMPQIQVSAQYRLSTNGTLGNGTTNTTATDGGLAGTVYTGGSSIGTNGLTVGATGQQLLWDFGVVFNRYRAQSALAEAQADTERTTRQALHLTVRTAYFSARAQKGLVQVARETLSNEEKHLKQVQGFVQVGTQPEIALAQEKTTEANARVQVITAENNYETSKAQLNQAMGIEDNTDYDVQDIALGPVEGEEQTTDKLLPSALASRPDFQTYDREVRAQKLTLDASRGAYGPSISLAGGITDQVDRGTGYPFTAYGLIGLSWTVFNGLTNVSVEQEAQASLVMYEAQRDTEKLQVRFDIEQARLAVRAANATLGAAQEAQVNARLQLKLAEGRYQTGVGSIIELGDAQVALTNAAAQAVTAEYNLSTARAQLIRALGRD